MTFPSGNVRGRILTSNTFYTLQEVSLQDGQEMKWPTCPTIVLTPKYFKILCFALETEVVVSFSSQFESVSGTSIATI